MNLRTKLILVSVMTYLLILFGFFFYTNRLILRGFYDLESEDIVEQTEIGLNTLDLRISELNHITSEYAERDDTYYFIQNNMRHFLNDIVSTSNFIENDINFMIITDTEGKVRYSKAFDLASLRTLETDEAFLAKVLDYNVLFDENGASGLVELDGIPVMIASHPITYSDDELPAIGTLICGRYINALELAKLRDYSYQNLEFIAYEDSPVELEEGITVWRDGEKTVSGLVAISDINDNPYLILAAESPRDLYHQGQGTVLIYYTGIVLTGILIGILSVYMINKTVVSRILGLSDEVSNIDPRSLESKSLSIPGDDEIAKLSMSIDEMLQTINEYQDLLTKRERMATIGETAAMVGHDLRNPLQVIYMLGSRLNRISKKLKEVDEVEQYAVELDYIESNLVIQTSYMNKIVSDLQDFSKSIALQSENVNLEAMVMDVLETVNAPNDMVISVEFHDGSEIVKVDGNYFKRVIVNLLTNAVQAMPESGALTIRGIKQDNQSVISISDTGVGISEENMQKLFTPLFTTKAKGTGLGLAVCKRIIDAHHGSISVESEEGVGTTFTIRLPSPEPDKDESDAPSIEVEHGKVFSSESV